MIAYPVLVIRPVQGVPVPGGSPWKAVWGENNSKRLRPLREVGRQYGSVGMPGDEGEGVAHPLLGTAAAAVRLLLQPFGVHALHQLRIRGGSHGVARAADVERAGKGVPLRVGRAAEADMAALKVHAQTGEVGVRISGKREGSDARFVGGRSVAAEHCSIGK